MSDVKEKAYRGVINAPSEEGSDDGNVLSWYNKHDKASYILELQHLDFESCSWASRDSTKSELLERIK